MAFITFAELKATGLAPQINLCPTDERFRLAVNRAVRYLLLHGSWYGTTRNVQIVVDQGCFIAPGAVANIEGVYTPCGAVDIRGAGYKFLPHWQPLNACGPRVKFIQRDSACYQRPICTPGFIRTYLTSKRDVGKTITYLGQDDTGRWIRTIQDGTIRDGERVVLASPFVDTINKFANLTGVVKKETEDRLLVYTLPDPTAAATDIAVYDYWETVPHYRRYEVPGWQSPGLRGCSCNGIEALVKLEFIPVKNDDDLMLIGNIPALELAIEALNAKDVGDLATADALLFGTRENKRLGAIPLLQQELRTYTSDTFEGHVAVQGSAGMRRVMAGFN